MGVRVLMVAHNGVLLSNQRKLEALVRQAKVQGLEMELTLLTPPKNLESAGWVELERESCDAFDIKVGWPLASMVAGKRYAQFYPFMGRYLKEIQPDVIDLWEEPWSAVSWQTQGLAQRICPKAKIIHETEQNIFKEFPFPFGAFEKKVLERTDWFIARNEEAKKVIVEKGFKGPISVLPNGLSEEDFQPNPSINLREQLGLGEFVVGYVGRLEEQKGILDLVAAREMMTPKPDLLLVGVGPLADKLKSTDERIFVHGPIPQKELPNWYAAMDVLVLPSRTMPNWKEQFGRTIIEAWAVGIPVIGSDSGAIPSVIGDAGLIFLEGNKEDLKNKMMLLTERSASMKYIELGKIRLRDNFTWQVIAEKMVGIYKKLMEKTQGNPSVYS